MRLTTSQKESNFIEFKGRKIELDLKFDNVLKAVELSNDVSFSGNEKIIVWAEMFIINYDVLKGLEESDLVPLINLIFKKISGEDKQSKNNDKKLFCFSQDADYIYASFKAVYGIDLYDLQGALQWDSFLSLLKGLPDDSKFKEIVGIRAAKIPKQTKTNKDEIRRLRELKALYALKDDDKSIDSRKVALNNKLSTVSAMFKSKGG